MDYRTYFHTFVLILNRTKQFEKVRMDGKYLIPSILAFMNYRELPGPIASRRGAGKWPTCTAVIAAVTTESAASPSLIFSSEDMVQIVESTYRKIIRF